MSHQSYGLHGHQDIRRIKVKVGSSGETWKKESRIRVIYRDFGYFTLATRVLKSDPGKFMTRTRFPRSKFLHATFCTFFGACLYAFGAFSGCADNAVDDSSLAVSGLPTAMKVGDTSQSATSTKSARDAAGRMKTTRDYVQFILISEDSAVLKPISERRLVALKAGTTKVHGKDLNGSLSSDAQSITVE
jgi:hypothetical protein